MEEHTNKVTSGGHTFYMDGYLKSNLDLLKKHIKADWDFMILISSGGRPGPGKTTLGMQVGKYLDPSFNLDRFVFDGKSLIEKGSKLKRYQCLLYDEGRTGLDAKKWASEIQRNLLDFFSTCRSLNLFIIVILPDFFELKKEIALNRSICLINVYCKKLFHRGYFSFHNIRTKKELFLFGKDKLDYAAARPKFQGRFVNYWVVDKVKYEALKRKSLQELQVTESKTKRDEWLSASVKAIRALKPTIKQNELAEMISQHSKTPLSRQSVGRLLE